MKLLALLVLLLLFYSCSSTPQRFHWNDVYGDLKVEYITTYDAAENRMHFAQPVYTNLDYIYAKHIESGKINSLKEWSCFNNDKSTNYINIIERYVPIFRTLAAKQNFTIKYKKVDAVRGLAHSNVYTEEIKDELKVTAKTCFIEDENGHNNMVHSEMYE